MLLSRSRSTRASDATSRVRDVMDGLRRIVQKLRLAARDAERSAGLSAAQLFVLQALATRPAASLNDLSQRTLTDQSSVSVVVARLTAARLVTRRASAGDARRVELRVTAEGRRQLAKSPEPTQKKLVHALLRLERVELDALASGLAALLREMGLEDTAPSMFFEDGSPASPLPRRRPRTKLHASREDGPARKRATARSGKKRSRGEPS